MQVPKDIGSKTKITELSKEDHYEEKELIVVHHLLDNTKKGADKEVVPKIIKNPFKVGEQISLDLYYIGIHAARLTIDTLPLVTVNCNKAFHFRGTAETSSLMRYIYRVYDVIDEYVDYTDIVPLQMTLKMDESRQNVSMALIYDHKKSKTTYWKKRVDAKGEVTEVKREDSLVPYAQDIFSSLYFIRTHDLKVGDKLKFVLHDNGKNWNMTIDVVKKESIWTRLGTVETFLLVPSVEREGEKFTKGKLNLWVTADDRRIPVKFEAEVRIGTMKGLINDYIIPKDNF